MVGGTLYLNSPVVGRRGVRRARPARCKWIYNPKSYEAGTTTMSAAMESARRGVLEPDGDSEERVYWGTGDGYLVAVDAKTGRPIDSFGVNGKVDLMDGLPRAKRGTRDYLNALTYSVQSPPIVVKDMVITPAAISSLDQRQGADSGLDSRLRRAHRQGALDVPHRCRSRASSAATRGRTALNEYAGKVTVWTMMSADEELGLLYLPTNTAAPDFYGGIGSATTCSPKASSRSISRPAQRVWHFQTVHHGLWDYDNPAAPNLLDITVNGDARQGAGADHEAGLRLHVRSRDRQAGVADRRDAGAGVRRAWRKGVADAAHSDEARAIRVSGRHGRRSRGLHAGDSRHGGRRRSSGFRIGPLVHAAVACKARSSRPGAIGRRQLVGRRRRSGDRDALRAVAQRASRVSKLSPPDTALDSNLRYMQTPRPQSADARGPAAVQAAVLAHDRDRHEHRRARVDGAGRRRRSHPQ